MAKLKMTPLSSRSRCSPLTDIEQTDADAAYEATAAAIRNFSANRDGAGPASKRSCQA